MVLAILLKIVLMLVATPGMIAPAATATKPAIKAYSMRSWPRVSFQILSFQTKLVIRVIISPLPAKDFFHRYEETPLLVVNTSEVDYSESETALDELIEKINSIKAGAHWFSPMGTR